MHRAKGDRFVRASGLPVRQCPNKQTNFKHNLLEKTMIFSLIFFRLEIGIFFILTSKENIASSPNIGEKKRFGITV